MFTKDVFFLFFFNYQILMVTLLYVDMMSWCCGFVSFRLVEVNTVHPLFLHICAGHISASELCCTVACRVEELFSDTWHERNFSPLSVSKI